MQTAKLIFSGLVVSMAIANASAEAKNPFEGHDLSKRPQSYLASQEWKALDLAFNAHVIGAVTECGCAVNPKGGADRWLNFMKSEQANGAPLFVDAGNALFPSPKMSPAQLETEKLKAALVFEAYAKMALQAQNVGELDLVAGVETLRKLAEAHKIPLVSTNLVGIDGKPLFETERQVDRSNGVKVTILGLSLGGASLPSGVKALDPVEALKAKLRSVPDDRIVVLLSDLGHARAEALASTVDRPMIIVESRDNGSFDVPVHQGSSLIVQPSIQGQQVGLLTIALSPKVKGWFNPEIARRYSERWDTLTKDNENMAAELAPYTPGDSRAVYEQRLVDMNIQWAAKNELSAAVAKFQTPLASASLKPSKKSKNRVN